LNPSRLLIVSDDTEFARTLMAGWQAERLVPEITLVSSDVWNSANRGSSQVVIVGPVRPGKIRGILGSLDPSCAAVCVTGDLPSIPRLRVDYPGLLVIPQQDGWVQALIQVASEALRLMEASTRALRAERLAASGERQAMLGRYMIEMRHSVNNALTSVIGNADLLLSEPGQLSSQSRDQIRTIHTMALRLNEIMQRFSSLAMEMQAIEKESQAETDFASRTLIPGS
jgi:signal transduction histidine kinase